MILLVNVKSLGKRVKQKLSDKIESNLIISSTVICNNILLKEKEQNGRALVDAREEIKRIQQQCQEIVTKSRNERDMKIQECEELRSQVRRMIRLMYTTWNTN